MLSATTGPGEKRLHDLAMRVALSVGSAAVIGALVFVLSGPDARPVNHNREHMNDGPVLYLFLTVLLAPLAETALQAGMILGFWRLCRERAWPTTLVTAAIMAGMHAFVSWRWALIVFPSFVVLSLTFLAYRRIGGFAMPFAATFLVHASQNIIGSSVALLSRS